MPRAPRFIVAHQVHVVAIRTIAGRHLFKPVPAIRDGVLGVIGRALSLFDVLLHAFVFLSNHAHLMLTPSSSTAFREFFKHVDRNTAELARRIFGFEGPVWGDVTPAAVLDEGAAVSQLQYILANSVKEGLVDDPRQWPGASSAATLLDGAPLEGVWRGRVYPVRITPLPWWANETADRLRERARSLAENAVALARLQRGGKPSLGVAGILAADPLAMHAAPESGPAPVAYASDPALLASYLADRAAFTDRYRVASERLRAEPQEEFPIHAFPPAPAANE